MPSLDLDPSLLSSRSIFFCFISLQKGGMAQVTLPTITVLKEIRRVVTGGVGGAGLVALAKTHEGKQMGKIANDTVSRPAASSLLRKGSATMYLLMLVSPK